MLRRSFRLQETGYYTEEGTPAISYKEILYRTSRRKIGHHNDKHHRWVEAENIQRNQDEAGTGMLWTPASQMHVKPVAERQTRRSAVCSFSARNVCSFVLVILLAHEFTQMHFQLMQLQQDARSLRQHVDKFLPLADTIANYALESQGARVLAHLSSDTYWPHRRHADLLWDRICYWQCSSETQRRVIQGHSSLHPGQCWCFSGDRGNLFISLSHPVFITHVTLGHIRKSQSPSGYIASAPRNFSVYGIRSTDEEGTCLGTLVYDQDGAAFQTFKLSKEGSHVFRYVKLQVESNWGNTDNTCLYSFRVHGKPSMYKRSHLEGRGL